MGIKDWAKKTVNAKTGNPQAPSKAGGMSRDKYLDDEAKYAAKKASEKASSLANAQGDKAESTTGSADAIAMAHEKAMNLHHAAEVAAKKAGLNDVAAKHAAAVKKHQAEANR